MKTKLIIGMILFLFFSSGVIAKGDLTISDVKVLEYKHNNFYRITIKNNGNEAIAVRNISIYYGEEGRGKGFAQDDTILYPGDEYTGEIRHELRIGNLSLQINPDDFETNQDYLNNNFEIMPEHIFCKVTGDDYFLYSNTASKCTDETGEYVDSCEFDEEFNYVYVKHYLCSFEEGCYPSKNTCAHNAGCVDGACIYMADPCSIDEECDDNDESTEDSCDRFSKQCVHEVIESEIIDEPMEQSDDLGKVEIECGIEDGNCPQECTFEEDIDCPECGDDESCNDDNPCTDDLCINNGCEYVVKTGRNINNNYCDNSGRLIAKKDNNEDCSDDFECYSNYCDNVCKNKSLVQRIFSWLGRFF